MNSRGWSLRETARHADISHTPISYALNGEQPSFDTCAALARAFNLPVDSVMRKAGLLPPMQEADEMARKVIHLLDLLTEDDRQEILEFIQLKIRLQEERDSVDRIVGLLEQIPDDRAEDALDALEAWLKARGVIRPNRNRKR